MKKLAIAALAACLTNAANAETTVEFVRQFHDQCVKVSEDRHIFDWMTHKQVSVYCCPELTRKKPPEPTSTWGGCTAYSQTVRSLGEKSEYL